MREEISTPRKLWVRLRSFETRLTNNHIGAGRGKCSLWQPECLSKAYSMEHSQIVTHPVIYHLPTWLDLGDQARTDAVLNDFVRFFFSFFSFVFLFFVNRSARVQGWRSGESTRLPPMWPGFDSQIQRHMWVELVGSLLCTERFTPVSPLLKNQHLTWFVLNY